MIIPAEVEQKFSNSYPYVESVSQRVKDKVLGLCEERGYAFVGRLKERTSIYEKIESGRYRKWSDIDDAYGCCIVCPSLNHEAKILDALEDMFIDSGTRRRGTTQKDPSTFRFDATRFIGRLRVQDKESPLSTIKFEIQIRTAFEHAWSVTTHAAVYKGKGIDWRQIRLAAQMKATVEQLDMIVMGFESSSSLIDPQAWPEIRIMQRIETIIRSGLENGRIPKEAEPASWTRLCENLMGVIKGIRKLRGISIDEAAELVIASIEVELKIFQKSDYPRSLPIVQFVLGALAKQHADSFSNIAQRGYCPIVTQELKTFYPNVSIYQNVFDLEN